MTNNNRPPKKQTGFTLVELLIATSVFSIVLLVVSTGIIKIGQSYYKGVIQAQTQETTRAISEDISRTIQLSNVQVKKPEYPDGTEKNIVCVGNIRYIYHLNQQVSNGVEGLTSYTLGPNDGCDDPAVGSDKKELLRQNMRLLKFEVKEADPLGESWRIDIRTAYGESDLLSHYKDDGIGFEGWDGTDIRAPAVQDALCKSGNPGGSFCSTSRLDILVKKRLN